MTRKCTIPALALADTRLTPRDITVLCAISYFSSRRACPSAELIAKTVGTSRQRVQASIKRLRMAGYISILVRHKKSGRQTTSKFTVSYAVEAGKKHREGGSLVNRHGDTSGVTRTFTPGLNQQGDTFFNDSKVIPFRRSVKDASAGGSSNGT